MESDIKKNIYRNIYDPGFSQRSEQCQIATSSKALYTVRRDRIHSKCSLLWGTDLFSVWFCDLRLRDVTVPNPQSKSGSSLN